MKKTMISVLALGLMSFTAYQTIENYRLHFALENVQEIEEYMLEDIKDGSIDPVLGEVYLELIYETEDLLSAEINQK